MLYSWFNFVILFYALLAASLISIYFQFNDSIQMKQLDISMDAEMLIHILQLKVDPSYYLDSTELFQIWFAIFS